MKHRMSVLVQACGLGALALLAVGGNLAGCARSTPRTVTPENQVAEMATEELVAGAGPEATPGARVTVHYTGWLYDKSQPDAKGAEFDSSRKGGDPFTFTLGAGAVIKGWDQGVAGMRIGGQRRLVIPAALGYGAAGAGGVIPPNATLVFDVELLDVAPSR
jgi:FKBP-type peptidyl-prolyl cis-trans isomerase FkpA